MRTLILSCALLLALAVNAQGKLLSADAVRAKEPLLPYCTWLPDPTGALGIEDVASGGMPGRFIPMPDGIPVKASGPVWVRLLLIRNQTQGSAVSSAAEKPRLVLQLGDLPPGRTRIYLSESPGLVRAEGLWHSEFIAPREDVLLPEPGLTPVSVYIRMDEMPGPWFAPMVSPQNAVSPDILPYDLILRGLIVAAMAVCLLRGFAGRAPWALWSAGYLGTLLLQAMLPLPETGRGFAVSDLPALLAPGLSLMLLPHVGRCLFRPDKEDNGHDGILYACSALGALVCLAPLLPSLGWLTRLFPLWALFFIPLLPLGLNAQASGKPGALAFFGAAAMPILGACVALAALALDPYLHSLAWQGALWGAAVGGLGLSMARVPTAERRRWKLATGQNIDDLVWDDEEDAENTENAPGETGAPERKEAAGGLDLDLTSLREPESAGALGHPFTTPPPFDVQAAEEEQAAPAAQAPEAPPPAHADAFPQEPAWEPDLPETDLPETAGAAAAQEAYAPADEESAAQEQPPVRTPDPEPVLPWQTPEQDAPASAFSPSQVQAAVQDVLESVRQSAEDTAAVPAERKGGRVISLVDEETLRYTPDAPLGDAPDFSAAIPQDILDELESARPVKSSPARGGGFVFNLHALVREVHDIIAPLAKNKGLLFSWYIAPSLPTLLEGDAPRLRGALLLLLQNAVQATERGSVGLSVRKTPGSTGLEDADPIADLLFSILDSGSAQRTDAGFFHAWELAGRTGGTFTVDYSPEGGTHINFTARFPLPSKADVAAHMALYAEEEALEARRDARLDEEDPIPVLHDVQRPGKAVNDAPAEREPGEQAEAPAYAPPPEAAADATPPAVAVRPRLDAENAVRSPHIGAPPLRSLPQRDTRSDALGGMPRILAIQMTSNGRKALAASLDGIPFEKLDAPDNAVALEMAHVTPPALVIFDGDTPEPDIINGIRQLQAQERQLGFEPMHVLTLTSHEAQAQRMRAAGSDLTLAKPFTRASIREAVAAAVPRLAPYAHDGKDEDAGLGIAIGGAFVPKEATPAATVIGGRVFTPPGQSADGTVEPFVAYMRVTPEQAPGTDGGAADGTEQTQNAGLHAFALSPVAELGAELNAENERDLAASIFLEEQAEPFAAPVPRAQAARPDLAEGAAFSAGPGDFFPEESPAPQDVEEAIAPAEAAPETMPAAEAPRLQETAPEANLEAPPETTPETPAAPQPQEPALPETQTEAEESTAAAPVDDAPLPDPAPAREPDPFSETGMGDTVAVQASAKAPDAADSITQAREALAVNAGEHGATAPPRIVLAGFDPQTEAHAPLRTGSLGADTIPPDPILGPPSGRRGIKGYVPDFGDTITTGILPPQAAVPPSDRIRPETPDTSTAEATATAPGSAPRPPSITLSPPQPLRKDDEAAAPLIMGLSEDDVAPAAPQPQDAAESRYSVNLVPRPKDAPDTTPAPPSAPVQDEIALDMPGPAAQAQEQTAEPARKPFLTIIPQESADAAASAEGEHGAAPEDAPAAEPPGIEPPLAQPLGAAPGTAMEAGPEENVPDAPVMEAAPQPEADLPDDAPAPQEDDAALPVQEQVQMFPLQGIDGEMVDSTMLPLLPGLVHFMRDVLGGIKGAAKAGNTLLAQEAAARLASRSEDFGLQKLGKITRCVERAAEADDIEAVNTLLEDLEPIAQRYIAALEESFLNFINMER